MPYIVKIGKADNYYNTKQEAEAVAKGFPSYDVRIEAVGCCASKDIYDQCNCDEGVD
jgi:hypothetical protein